MARCGYDDTFSTASLEIQSGYSASMKPSTQMASKCYVGFGSCIYCGQPFPKEQLTDEHIVPLALNGSLIIRDAACDPCRAISNESYENLALQADLLVPRLLLGLKRRKKKIQKQMPIGKIGNHAMGDREGADVHYTVESYPKTFSMVHFPPPGKLTGVDMGGGLKSMRVQIVNLGIEPLPSAGVTLITTHNHTAFSLTIAKIGYCFGVAELGKFAFDSSEIIDLLLGRRDDVYNFVGSDPLIAPRRIDRLHWLSLLRVGGYWVARVQLFASCGISPYHVVLGEAK